MPERAPPRPLRPATSAGPFGAFVLSCAALAAGLLSAPALTQACTYVPVNFSLLGERVPVSGPIIVDVDCQQSDYCKVGAPPQLLVFDGAQAVEGSLEMVRGDVAAFLVWRPTAPLQEGRAYQIQVREVEGSAGRREFTVRADASFVWAAASEPSWTFDHVVEDTGERFCCFAAQACFDHCFTEKRIVKAVLTPVIARTPEQATTVYELRWSEADGARRELSYRRPSRFQQPSQWDVLAKFEQPAQEYCATLEVRNLVDGRSQEFSRCFAPDSSVSYGESVAFTPDSSTLQDCQVPPGVDFECQGSECEAPSQMYLRAWCDANRTLCASSAQRSYCERYAGFCDGVLVENGAAGCAAAPSSTPLGWPLWLLAATLWRRRRRP